MSILTCKGYQGRFDYDAEADIFHGEVLHLTDVIAFQGRSIDELKQEDSPIELKSEPAKEGRSPEKPFCPLAASTDLEPGA